MQDIPNDCNREIFKSAFVLPNGQHIQHGLSRVLMATVPSIDHGYAGGHRTRNKMREPLCT